MRGRKVAAAVLLVVLVACTNEGNPAVQGDAATTTSTTVATTTTTEAPTTTTTGVVAAGALEATPVCPAVPPRREPDPDRPRYDLRLRVALDENAVVGDLSVRFVPDLPTDRLVFRLWPNGPRPSGDGARLDVGPVSIDGRAPAPGDVTDPTTLVVDLGREVAPGRAVTASLPWRLTLPGAANDRIARYGDTVRLGSFFPILAWEPGFGWAVEPPTSHFAEASTAPVADFDLRVEAPEGLTVLASGTPAGPGRWEAVAMRDVAVAVGRFRQVEGVANAPHPVRVTVAVDAGVADDPAVYLDRTLRGLEDFAGRFGAYPWLTHTLSITPGLRGGIEYPGHVLQGPETHGRTTPHEVGHLWFYALVGNNQGRDPWLDEGLATWAEARFLGVVEEVRTRAIPAAAAGNTGQPMTFWERRRDAYYRGVYVQGAQVLAALGDPDLVDCGLRHFVAANAFRVARPADLLAAMQTVFPDAAATFERFGAI